MTPDRWKRNWDVLTVVGASTAVLACIGALVAYAASSITVNFGSLLQLGGVIDVAWQVLRALAPLGVPVVMVAAIAVAVVPVQRVLWGDVDPAPWRAVGWAALAATLCLVGLVALWTVVALVASLASMGLSMLGEPEGAVSTVRSTPDVAGLVITVLPGVLWALLGAAGALRLWGLASHSRSTRTWAAALIGTVAVAVLLALTVWAGREYAQSDRDWLRQASDDSNVGEQMVALAYSALVPAAALGPAIVMARRRTRDGSDTRIAGLPEAPPATQGFAEQALQPDAPDVGA